MKLSSKKKVKSYSIERGFVSKLLQERDMKFLKDQQIKASFFTGEHRKVYSFIQKHFRETGEFPTERVILLNFPNYELEYFNNSVGTEESLLYWSNQLRTKAKHNKTADLVEKVAKALDEGKSDEAYSELKKGVWKIEDDVVIQESVDITKDTEDRKKAYLDRKKNEGIVGIPTGIDKLDYICKGLAKETLSVLVAPTGYGKTFFLTLVGAHAQLNNYKVCCFLTEMSADQMRDRFEAMLFGMMYGEFNYQNFKSGRLSLEQEKQYFQFLEDDLPRLEPLILETVTGVSSIISVIEKEKPDLILVDGAYLMEDEEKADSDWLRVTHITRALKRVAKQWHIPILINSQADLKHTSKKTGAELKDISYSQSLSMDADNVWSLFRDEVMFNDKEMMIKVLKNREGTQGKVLINWDFTKMDFTSIYSEEAEFNEDGTESEESGIINAFDNDEE